MNFVPSLLVYHGDCPDGELARHLACEFYPVKPRCIPWIHGNTDPDPESKALDLETYRDQNVLFVDVTPPAAFLSKVRQVTRALYVIDHHHTGFDIAQEVLLPSEYLIDLRQKYSGAGLFFRHVMDKRLQDMSFIVSLINRYDTDPEQLSRREIVQHGTFSLLWRWFGFDWAMRIEKWSHLLLLIVALLLGFHVWWLSLVPFVLFSPLEVWVWWCQFWRVRKCLQTYTPRGVIPKHKDLVAVSYKITKKEDILLVLLAFNERFSKTKPRAVVVLIDETSPRGDVSFSFRLPRWVRDVNLAHLAKEFGGGGHPRAAATRKNKEYRDKFLY